MTINAISAQALRPAVNFKKTEAPAGEKLFAPEHKEDSKKTAAKVLGGAVALAALGYGIYRYVKAGKAKQAEELLNKRHANISSYEKMRLANNKAVEEANNIVAEHDAMLRRLCDHSQKNVELNAMNWDAQPLKYSSDVVDGLRKEELRKLQKEIEDFALKMRTAK